MTHLRSISLRSSSNEDGREPFPFDLPAVQSLRERSLQITSPVTFFVGENGSGKSTLLEAIAWATQLPAVGQSDMDIDPTLEHGRALGSAISLEWAGSRVRRGFFLRAEDFFGFAKRMDTVRAELEADVRRLKEDDNLSDRARGFALQAPMRELAALQSRYGDGVDSRSHGEQFLNLFGSQIGGKGLYLLDEPEAPLSPNRQLSLISLIMHATREENAQFIIATHSPMIMAIPNAQIYQFDASGILRVTWDTIDHVTITRDFLLNPDAFLRYL